MRIVGIGIAARDITVRVDPLPAADSKAPASGFAESGGGPVPTALVTLARLGHDCLFGGIVGADATGWFILADLESERVDTGGVVRLPGVASPVSVILVEGDGRRRVLEWNQSDVSVTPAEMGRALQAIDGCRALLIDARFPEVQIEAARRARRAGALVMLDCGHPRPGADDLLALSDVAIFSHSYPRRLHGDAADLPSFVRTLRESMATDGARIAGVTLGQEGCLVADGSGGPVRVPAIPVEAVDTTGAGDVFHGAFLHELLSGAGAVAAARFANAAAGLKCRGLTGRAQLPQEADIRKAISY